jgi:hypothetical protein
MSLHMVLVLASCVSALPHDSTAKTPQRVGQILVVGNESTYHSFILQQITLEPGQEITENAVRQSERNLARLSYLFMTTEKAHPAIMVLNGDGKSDYRDILVQVTERPGARWMWKAVIAAPLVLQFACHRHVFGPLMASPESVGVVADVPVFIPQAFGDVLMGKGDVALELTRRYVRSFFQPTSPLSCSVR